MSEPVPLTASARRAFDRLGGDLARVFDHRLIALVASSAASSVAFVTALEPGDLDALAAVAPGWHREGLDTPLLITPHEFTRSLDVFPVEYQAILDRHTVVRRDPRHSDVFAGLIDGARVNAEDLRRACEVQAKSHLLHLRQGWVEAHGHDNELAGLLARSAAPLRALLVTFARLTGGNGASALDGARAAALSPASLALVEAVLALESDPDAAPALVPRLGEYLTAATELWAAADAWRPR